MQFLFGKKGCNSYHKSFRHSFVTSDVSNRAHFSENELKTFLVHSRNVAYEYEAIIEIKSFLTQNKILFHIDFSENFNCKFADEIGLDNCETETEMYPGELLESLSGLRNKIFIISQYVPLLKEIKPQMACYAEETDFIFLDKSIAKNS